MKKKLKFIIAGFLGLILVVFLVSYVFLGSIVKAGVETITPKLTKTDVGLGWVTMSPFSGGLTLRSLEVGNPKGFETDFAVKMGRLRVKAQPGSVFSDTIIVNSVVVDGPELSYENTEAGNNLKTIQRNVESFVPASGGDSKEKPAKEKNVFIRDLLVKNAKLHWTPRLLGGKTMTLDLPDLHLENFGTEKQGIPVSKAVSKVLGSMIASSGTAVASAGKDLGKGAVEGVKDVGKSVKKLFGK